MLKRKGGGPPAAIVKLLLDRGLIGCPGAPRTRSQTRRARADQECCIGICLPRYRGSTRLCREPVTQPGLGMFRQRARCGRKYARSAHRNGGVGGGNRRAVLWACSPGGWFRDRSLARSRWRCQVTKRDVAVARMSEHPLMTGEKWR